MIKEVLTSVRKTCIWALAPVGMLVAFSCQDDIVAERQPVSVGNEISFAIGGDSVQSVISRSGKKMSRHFITMMGKDSVFLQAIEEKNHELPFDLRNRISRSASFIDENLKSFNLYAYLNDDAQFMNDTKVSLDEEKSDENNKVWSYSPIKYWPNNEGDYISFYGYALYNNNGDFTNFTINKLKQSASFSYELPAATSNDEEVKNDAEKQPDLIFSITPEQKKKAINGKVNLVFHHALSAILFKMGNMPEGVVITDISLKSVSTSGDCTYSLVEEDGEMNMVFKWSGQNEDGNYTQTFNKTKTTESGEVLITGNEQLFMMIPQNLDEAILEISFKVGEKTHVLQSPLNLEDFPQSWNADTKYTYVISTSEMVDVEIDDLCTATVKSDVKIQNTGFSDAYLRATVVGYWVNQAGIIVEPWSFEDDTKGSIDWSYDGTAYWESVSNASKWGDYWERKEDGFYYYKHIVSPTQYTYPLFDKYTLKEDAVPFEGAELIVNVVVQAVDDNLKW